MNQLLIQIIFSWPFMVLSILASIVGILNNRAWIVFLGALMIIPFAYNLNSLPPFGGYALLLPFLQIGSAAPFTRKTSVGVGVVRTYNSIAVVSRD
jgi:hypothetical protein